MNRATTQVMMKTGIYDSTVGSYERSEPLLTVRCRACGKDKRSRLRGRGTVGRATNKLSARETLVLTQPQAVQDDGDSCATAAKGIKGLS